MCLLVFMPEGTTASKKSLENAAWYNDDGFGWAIRTPDKILVGKNMDFEAAYDEFMSARSSYNGDALFHLRITTQGGTNLDNCHPFYVGKDQLSVVAHNGMLPVNDDKTGRSDTRIFAESLLPKRGGISFLNGEQSLAKLEKWAEGSKLVFLTANPASKWRYVIVGMKDGHWGKDEDDGVWFSNSSYKYSPSKSTSYVGGWGGHFGWDNYGSYSVYTQKGVEGTTPTTPKIVAETTADVMREELAYELQHHAYEIVQTLFDDHLAEGKDMDDPTVIENGYYNCAEELLERFLSIYKPYDYETYTAKCGRCGGEMFLDHLDIPATHCSHCDCCLYCGSDTIGCDHAGDCCAWPMGYAMTYDPSTVSLIKEGGDKREEKVPEFF